MVQLIRRFYASLAILLALSISQVIVLPVHAVGPVGPIGPQGEIGPQEPVGVQTPGPVSSGSLDASPAPTSTPDPVADDTSPSASPIPTPSATTVMTPSPSPTVLSSPSVSPTLIASPSPTQEQLSADALSAPNASDSSLENNTTGPNSENQNNRTSDNQTTVDENNTTDIDNTVAVHASTGENHLSNNTHTGDLQTGDIAGSVTLLNIANSAFAPGSSVNSKSLDGRSLNQLNLSPLSQGVSLLGNQSTGPNSSNVNVVDGNNVIQFLQNNNANVQNDVSIDANTGDNHVTGNTHVGNIETGDIDLAVNLINLLNVWMPNTVWDIDVWSLFNGLNGDIILPELANSVTGPNSINENEVESSNDVAVTITNTSEIDNSFDVDANTGGNTIENNTTTGDISTGDTNVEGSVVNIANVTKPILYIVNVFGEWMGSLLGLNPDQVIVNQVTGPNSENTSTVNEENTVSLEQNNTAAADNRVRINANTGRNTVRENTEVGTIATGAVNVYGNIVNVLNSVGKDLSQFALRVVNIFGDWTGNARGTEAQSASSNPSNVTSTTAGLNSAPSLPTAAPSPIEPVATGPMPTPSQTESVVQTYAQVPTPAPIPTHQATPTVAQEVKTALSTLPSRLTTSLIPQDKKRPAEIQKTEADAAAQENENNYSHVTKRTQKPVSAQTSPIHYMPISLFLFVVIALWGGVEYLAARQKKGR